MDANVLLRYAVSLFPNAVAVDGILHCVLGIPGNYNHVVLSCLFKRKWMFSLHVNFNFSSFATCCICFKIGVVVYWRRRLIYFAFLVVCRQKRMPQLAYLYLAERVSRRVRSVVWALEWERWTISRGKSSRRNIADTSVSRLNVIYSRRRCLLRHSGGCVSYSIYKGVKWPSSCDTNLHFA